MTTTPHYTDDAVTLFAGDCIEVMRSLPDASVDAVVTDPPYGLEFMGKEWDAPWRDSRAYIGRGGDVHGKPAPVLPQSYVAGASFQHWCEQWAAEALRVLKPGGHLAAFGGTRTYHRLACAIEDAGFEIRDNIMWQHMEHVFCQCDREPGTVPDQRRPQTRRGWPLCDWCSKPLAPPVGSGGPLLWEYGSGFPKSLDVSKAIDKAAGAEREVVGSRKGASNIGRGSTSSYITSEVGTVTDIDITAPATDAARQWHGWGTALKPAYEPIVLARKPLTGTVAATVLEHGTGALNIDGCRVGTDEDTARKPAIVSDTSAPFGVGKAMGGNGSPLGRWPANVVLDADAAAILDAQSGTGGASRFFYTAKAGRDERPTAERKVLRLRDDLTPEQVGLVVAQLREAGVEVD